jgi:hypothetical protein
MGLLLGNMRTQAPDADRQFGVTNVTARHAPEQGIIPLGNHAFIRCERLRRPCYRASWLSAWTKLCTAWRPPTSPAHHSDANSSSGALKPKF